MTTPAGSARTIPIVLGTVTASGQTRAIAPPRTPCECNACGGIDEPAKLSPIARVTLDKNGPGN